MAMQVKHMVTFGLGLGIATAFGYHFLSSPRNNVASVNATQVTPLDSFEIAQPPALTSTAPAQPEVNDHFRVEAQPLLSPEVRSMPADRPQTDKLSYKDLVAAMPASVPPAEPVMASTEIADSGTSFSLDHNISSNVESDFVFDDAEVTARPIDADATEDSFQLELLPADSSEDLELDMAVVSQAADEVLADDRTFEVSSAQPVPVQSQDESFAVVVDYNSKRIDRSVDTLESTTGSSNRIAWKPNPFIDNTPAVGLDTNTPADAEASFDLELPQASVTREQSAVAMQNVKPVQAEGSVLSLMDPMNESPYQSQSRERDLVPVQPEQLAPQVQLSLDSAAAQKAVHHIEYGKTLSRRGAAFTARQEFLAALQVIAASNDRATGGHRHSKALRTAMITIKEANDFSVANSEQQIYMDVTSVVESHQSRVLTRAQAASLSPVQAMNRYFAHAQDQLDLAGGRNVVSSEVFYCMGKLHTLLNRKQKVLGPYETAQSVVYHQAALLSDNQHHRSANELGVLLARSGRLEQSKMLFERSLMSQPTVRTWQNLAEAHRRLGETGFANQASAEVQMLANSSTPRVQSNNIQWKPVEVFNADAPVEFTPQQQRVASLPSAPVARPNADSGKPSAGKSIADRIKGIF